MYWYNLVIICIASLAFLLHIIGALMRNLKFSPLIQSKTLFKHLSITEVSLCITTVLQHVLEETKNDQNLIKMNKSITYLQLTQQALYVPFLVHLFLLTQERAFIVYFNTRYKTSSYSMYKNKLAILGWVFGGFYLCSLTFSNEFKPEYRKDVYNMVKKDIHPGLSILLTLQFLVVYIHYGLTAFRPKSRYRQDMFRQLLLPCMVHFTFIILKAVPDVILLMRVNVSQLVLQIFGIATEVNIALDAMMLIIVQLIVNLGGKRVATKQQSKKKFMSMDVVN